MPAPPLRLGRLSLPFFPVAEDNLLSSVLLLAPFWSPLYLHTPQSSRRGVQPRACCWRVARPIGGVSSLSKTKPFRLVSGVLLFACFAHFCPLFSVSCVFGSCGSLGCALLSLPLIAVTRMRGVITAKPRIFPPIIDSARGFS
jgi:hypothetical protein